MQNKTYLKSELVEGQRIVSTNDKTIVLAIRLGLLYMINDEIFTKEFRENSGTVFDEEEVLKYKARLLQYSEILKEQETYIEIDL